MSAMNFPPDLPGLSRSGWSRSERTALLLLSLLLVGLFFFRAEMRRQDGSRVTLASDIVVVHIAGLRGDALAADDIASDIGLDSERVLAWSNAFSPSGDSRRSLLSLLRGDLVLNLDHPPGADSLAAQLGSEGWTTHFVGEGDVPSRAAEEFAYRLQAEDPSHVPGLVEQVVAGAGTDPLLLVVHMASLGEPLHTKTTDSEQLRSLYGSRIQSLRGTLARIGQALASRERAQLIAVVGGSGLELGGHPEFPDRPWDDHLRVPMVLGQRFNEGLPWGHHGAMVQTPDLTLTLLDLVDVRDRGDRAGDGSVRTGKSLEPLVHGWTTPPVHEQLFFADVGHAAVRTESWKLISPVLAPWQLREEAALLFALGEDPSEQFNLVAERRLGPTGRHLVEGLRSQLARPEMMGSRSGEAGGQPASVLQTESSEEMGQ